MSLIVGHADKLAIIVGKLVSSGAFTDVIGGTLTAASSDSGGSQTITWAPAMISAPAVFASILSAGANTSNIAVAQITGVTVSNCGLFIGTTPVSGVQVSFMVVGQARL